MTDEEKNQEQNEQTQVGDAIAVEQPTEETPQRQELEEKSEKEDENQTSQEENKEDAPDESDDNKDTGEEEDTEEEKEDGKSETKVVDYNTMIKEKFGDSIAPDQAQAKIAQLVSELEEYKKINTDANSKLVEVFKAEGDLLNIVRDVSQGLTVEAAIAKNMDVNALKEFDDEESLSDEEIKKAIKQRKEKIKKQQEAAQMIQSNLQQSQNNVKDFMKEKGLNEDVTGEFLDQVDKVMIAANQGLLSKEFLNQMYLVLNYEDAVRAAELKGRNAKAEDLKSEKEPQGDGLPRISGSTNASTPKLKTNTDDADPVSVLIGAIDKWKERRNE